LFLNERENDQVFNSFVNKSVDDIFSIFEDLREEDNYFAKRLSLKTLYLTLVKYENLRKAYIMDRERLKCIMQLVLDENKGI
jgi:hypothetical protein